MSEAIVTDKTLTIEDAPADAKATGDAINNLRGAVGSPLVAATAASMTDTNKVYVYVGSETGYTNGNWYYYNGTTWVSGGVYNSVAVDLDTTLKISGKASDSKSVGDAIDELWEDLIDLQELTETRMATAAIYETASGEIASFSDGADDMPMKSCVVKMEPIQEGEGDPSPENVRPISGRTGLSVVRTGKNLLGGLALGQSIVDAINKPQNAHFGEDSTGKFVALAAGSAISDKNFTSGIKFKENTQYTIILKATKKTDGNISSNIQFRYTDGSKGSITITDSSTTVPTTVVTSLANKTVKQIETGYYGGTTYIYYENCGIFEGVVTNADYEPYKGSIYSVNWETEAGTVYDGILDVVSGKLTIDWYSIPSSSWSVYKQNNGFICYRSLKNPPIVGNNILSNMLSKYGSFSSSNMNENILQLPSTTTLESTIYIALNESADISELKVIYKTPNSTEIQLTPQEIRTLLGENNIWSNSGDVEVEYPADTKTYLDENVSELKNEITVVNDELAREIDANINVSPGFEQGFWKDSFSTTRLDYIRTVSGIPVVEGDTITVDTNGFVGTEVQFVWMTGDTYVSHQVVRQANFNDGYVMAQAPADVDNARINIYSGGASIHIDPADYSTLQIFKNFHEPIKKAVKYANYLNAEKIRELSVERGIPINVLFENGHPTLGNRYDYIHSINTIFVHPGDTLVYIANIGSRDRVNIDMLLYDADNKLLSTTTLATTSNTTRVYCDGVNIPDDSTANYIRFTVWSTSVSTVIDSSDFLDWLSVRIINKKSIEFLPIKSEIIDEDAIGVTIPEKCLWLYGLYERTTGEYSTYKRCDYVHTYNLIPCSPGDMLTIDLSNVPTSELSKYYQVIVIGYDATGAYVGNLIRTILASSWFDLHTMAFTVPDGANYIRLMFWTGNGNLLHDLASFNDVTLIYINRPEYSAKNKIESSALKLGVAKDCTTQILGANIPANASHDYNLSNNYINTLKSAVEQWMTQYAGDEQIIPAIIHTDQHGALNWKTGYTFSLLSYFVNWKNISAIFNLGDTIGDHWSEISLHNTELENATYALRNIPDDKQINLFGNHDTWCTLAGQESYGSLPSLKYLNPYFPVGKQRTVKLPDNSGNMVIYDDAYMVKYVVIGTWDYTESGLSNAQPYISAYHWKWIIKQLSENDGYDIIVVSHIPIIAWSGNCINAITKAPYADRSVQYFSLGFAESQNPFLARREKISGSIVVANETINYDFTGCETSLLCSIAGHTHTDLIDWIGGSSGVLAAAFDRFYRENHVIHFVLFDRNSKKLKTWKFSGYEETATIESWEAAF